jgi:hypothetical protein
VVAETEDVGPVVPPTARLTRRTTAAVTMRETTPTEIQTTLLLPCRVIDIKLRWARADAIY